AGAGRQPTIVTVADLLEAVGAVGDLHLVAGCMDRIEGPGGTAVGGPPPLTVPRRDQNAASGDDGPDGEPAEASLRRPGDAVGAGPQLTATRRHEVPAGEHQSAHPLTGRRGAVGPG